MNKIIGKVKKKILRSGKYLKSMMGDETSVNMGRTRGFQISTDMMFYLDLQVNSDTPNYFFPTT